MAEEQKAEVKKGLVMKLAEVMAAVGWIEKSGYNEFHKYKYAQESDLVNALRGELAKRHIMVFPDVKNVTRNEHITETLKWDDTVKAKVPTARKTQLTEISVEWTFVDGESGESRTITVHGVGEDNMDKGFYKAFTGSEKYMLMKTFLIPTGDDPEKDSKEEAEDARKAGLASAKQLGEEKIKKARPSASQSVPSLFYALQPSGQYAVQGDKDLMRKIYPQFKANWQPHAECFMVSEANLEVLKFQCEEAKIPFSVLKGPRADEEEKHTFVGDRKD